MTNPTQPERTQHSFAIAVLVLLATAAVGTLPPAGAGPLIAQDLAYEALGRCRSERSLRIEVKHIDDAFEHTVFDNLVHGSDSPESAERELTLFFGG